MQCPSCGTVNEAGRKFCHECGTRLESACAVCGTVNQAGARFCGECGNRLAPPDAGTSAIDAPTPAAGLAPPGSATPTPTAERRHVTVLFADLVGFTALSEGRDAEAVRDLLSRYFDLAKERIERYGGVVEKFIGDAVMAVWGAPTAHEDDAERAVRAAMDLVDAVRLLGPEVQARAGVLTGEAAVTLGATDQGMVAGDLVNTASRLQSVAPPGAVLVGEATQRAAAGAIAFESVGAMDLKGKESAVPAWRALRIVAERGGRGRSDRLEPPFIGRETELRLLKDLYHASARESRVRLVSITGQPGIGKSRLAWEFLKYVDGVVDYVWWHEGRCPAYGDGVTFWALGEMVRTRAGLAETDDAETTRAKVVAMVAEHVPDEGERRAIEPAMFALLGIGDAPAGGRDELFRAWRTFFERLSLTAPVAMLFEDLHWADPGLLDFIDHMLEWSRGCPILIVTLSRPELLQRRPDWGAGRRSFLAMGLEPLDDPAMLELIEGLVPAIPSASAWSIVARADGIPLYAVETIRMLVADGRLREAEGHYEPTGELGELEVPETLQALISARLDGLGPGDRALLQDAAVLGQSFTLAGLSSVSGHPIDEVEERLRGLGDLDLVVHEVDPRSPERGQYAFVQALIREVAYNTLAKRDRRSRHLAAARFFESLEEDELASALAAHYAAAYEAAPEGPEGEAVAVQARLALVGAADRAIALGSFDQAITFLQQATQLPAPSADRAAVLERLGRAATTAARFDVAVPPLTEAIALRETLGDKAGRYRAIVALVDAHLASRHNESAAATLEPAIATATGEADEADQAGLLILLARLRWSDQRQGEALAAIDQALQIAERLDLFEIVAEGLALKGSTLSNQDRVIEGMALLDAARRLSTEHGLIELQARIINLQSNVQGSRDPRAAFELEMDGIRLARDTGRRMVELTLIGNAGEDAIRLGMWDWLPDELRAIDLEPTSTIRGLTEFSAMVVRLLRGDSEARAAADQFLVVVVDADPDDVDIENVRADLLAYVAFTDGRFADAHVSWLRQASVSDLNAPYALPRAARAAVLAGDVPGAQHALERMTAIGARGGVLDTERAMAEAGIAAIEGRTSEAVVGFRSAIGRWRDHGLPWDEAVCGWIFLSTVGADDPDARAAGLEARAILERLGAQAIIAHVDRLLGEDRSAGTGLAAVMAGERVPGQVGSQAD